MTEESDLFRVRAVAQHILDALGDRAPDWVVLDVIEAVDTPEPAFLVMVGTDDKTSMAGGYFSRSLPEPQAIVQLATHLQDHASESASSFGAPLPPCPGHQHPLSPEVVNGVAVWVCPKSAAHYQQPIAG